MTSLNRIPSNEALYALSWECSQDGKIAFDPGNLTVIDANPAMETLMGRSRDELVGISVTHLHPQSEHERVLADIGSWSHRATLHTGLHIQCRDGHVVPVQIWCSDPVMHNGRELAIVEFRDITLRLQNQLQLASQNWALSAFSGAALALCRARTEEDLLQSICDAITDESVYVLAYVSIAEDDPVRSIRFAAASGSASGYLEGLRLSWAEDDPFGQGPVGACIRTAAIQIVDNFETAPNFTVWRERARKFGVRSAVAVPLSVEGGWKGVLMVYSAKAGAFEAEPVEVFQHLGEQIVHGILALRHKQQLNAERLNLEKTQRQLVEALSASVAAMVTAMETRDPYTTGHESRVADIAVAIGQEMGLDGWRLQGMRLAAMVHDIGKIAIPSDLLNKPARLTPAEFELIKAHPETGYTILKSVPFPWPVAQMVRQHHEKLDGSGYPLGLNGDELLLESRIIAVADIVEAMASNRPYRRTLGLEAALAEVESMAGAKLDANAVRICAALFRERRLMVPGLDWNCAAIHALPAQRVS
ncbi:MAG: HD domain-containing phosphohydrolase [Terracidiphilus sp.]